MANDIEVYIFILVLISIVVFGGTVGRLWILRHRRRTFAVNFSDTAAVLFAFAMVVAVGLGFDGVRSELHIQRTYGVEDVRSRLLTHKYLQVSQPVSQSISGGTFGFALVFTMQSFFIREI